MSTAPTTHPAAFELPNVVTELPGPRAASSSSAPTST